MNILIIEDNEYKFKQIEAALRRILKNPNIIWMDSRNSGLISFRLRNIMKQDSPYHIVITDNYLPLYSMDDNDMFEKDENIEPFASDIVNEIRRLGFDNIPIIVCSSEEIEECDYNYFIKYNPSVSLDNQLKKIFEEILAYLENNNTTLEEIVIQTKKMKSAQKLRDSNLLEESTIVKKLVLNNKKEKN
ncbi:MAG: hypothetical protein ACI4WW_07100 [Candidatus Coprovivens sp.]